MSRHDEIAAGLDAVRGRIAEACSAAGRDVEEVALVVVTKFFPAADVETLAGLGVREVAENRHQEAEEKRAACAGLGLRWHFVGGLQSNKAAALTRWADVVQSVDRPKLVGPLARGAQERGSELDVWVQVSLDPPGSDHRAGADPDDVGALADRIAQEEALRLRGLMAVAPLGEPPAPAFARLREIQQTLLAEHPDAVGLSAGMSGDLEAAVAAGATHLRVGSAVLGSRPAVQ